MTPDEFKSLWKACGINKDWAVGFVVYCGIVLFVGLMIAGNGAAQADVDFRWPVMNATFVAAALPWVLTLLNGLLIGLRALVTGHNPNSGGVRLGREERKQLRKAERTAELARRTAALERELEIEPR